MIWRFGLYDNTFDPLWMTDWALAAVLLLPMVFGALGAVFRPSRLLPVALACLPILLAGGVMVLDYQQVGLLRWQWEVAGIELTLRLSGLSALMLLITQWTAREL